MLDRKNKGKDAHCVAVIYFHQVGLLDIGLGASQIASVNVLFIVDKPNHTALVFE